MFWYVQTYLFLCKNSIPYKEQIVEWHYNLNKMNEWVFAWSERKKAIEQKFELIWTEPAVILYMEIEDTLSHQMITQSALFMK